MYGLCPEELRDDLMRWISKIIHKDIHVKLQRQKGLGRRSICCFEDPLKKKKRKSRIWSYLGRRLPWGSDRVR